MKKIIGCVLLLLLALALGCAAAQAETTTLLVYMCGTDLQSDACEDLYEMADAENGEDVNIVVLAGGTAEWDLDILEGNTRNLLDFQSEADAAEDWGYKSMGSPESLEEFLTYGLTNYPADRTIVILWDHGGGSECGVCFDETANDDGLTVVEINKVLASVSRKVPNFHIDIFGCDACMMATYEMAAMLSHYNIDFYVANFEHMKKGIILPCFLLLEVCSLQELLLEFLELELLELRLALNDDVLISNQSLQR